MALASASVYMVQLLPKEVCVWIRLRKPIHRPGWWKGNFALFQILATVGWWAICPKANPPSQLPTSKGPRAFIGRSGGQLPAETAHLLTSLTVIFRLVLTSIILAVLGSYSSVPGSVCSHFFAAESRNCSSSCPGYSWLSGS